MKDTGVVLDDDVSKRRRLRPVRSCDSLVSAATTPVKHSGMSFPLSVTVTLHALLLCVCLRQWFLTRGLSPKFVFACGI